MDQEWELSISEFVENEESIYIFGTPDDMDLKPVGELSVIGMAANAD